MRRIGHEARKRPIWIFILAVIIIGVIGTVAYFIIKHPVSIVKETEWAIGIYRGDSYSNLFQAPGIKNPVLRGSDVTDVRAEFIADPFMVQAGDKWYMFFEVMNSLTSRGEIGCAVSQDGLHWKYLRTVLKEPFHLSYPYVFEWEDQFYMIPESADANSIRLYRAENFPYSWTFVSDLIKGPYCDTSVFYTDKTWWMLTCSQPKTNDELRLFFADGLTGPWTEHPASPVVRGDPSKARLGGRILVVEGGIIRFAQDDRRTYGKKVREFVITEISKTKYTEREYPGNPILSAQGKGWNRHGMHHLDAHEITRGNWIAVVDGYKKKLVLKIEY